MPARTSIAPLLHTIIRQAWTYVAQHGDDLDYTDFTLPGVFGPLLGPEPKKPLVLLTQDDTLWHDRTLFWRLADTVIGIIARRHCRAHWAQQAPKGTRVIQEREPDRNNTAAPIFAEGVPRRTASETRELLPVYFTVTGTSVATRQRWVRHERHVAPVQFASFGPPVHQRLPRTNSKRIFRFATGSKHDRNEGYYMDLAPTRIVEHEQRPLRRQRIFDRKRGITFAPDLTAETRLADGDTLVQHMAEDLVPEKQFEELDNLALAVEAARHEDSSVRFAAQRRLTATGDLSTAVNYSEWQARQDRLMDPLEEERYAKTAKGYMGSTPEDETAHTDRTRVRLIDTIKERFATYLAYYYPRKVLGPDDETLTTIDADPARAAMAETRHRMALEEYEDFIEAHSPPPQRRRTA